LAVATSPPIAGERLLTRRRSPRRLTYDRLIPFLLIAPSVILIAVFVYGFIGYSAFVSTTAWYGILPDYTSVGLRQYQQLFELPRFQEDISNTVRFTSMFLGACILLGFGSALLLEQKLRGTIFFQNIFLFPMAISFVVTGTLWRWVFNPNFGINVLFEQLHLGFLKSPWLTDTRTALYGLVIAATWQMSGYCMAMFLAGLRSIPEELREAAQVDGARAWQAFWYVILPLLRPVTVSAVIVLGHISLKIFDLVFVMTSGGPGYATDMPGLYMFVATFKQNLYARGAAIAMVLLVMVALVIIPYLVYNLRQEPER
jgi:glucose/mannose transport system permease protein